MPIGTFFVDPPNKGEPHVRVSNPSIEAARGAAVGLRAPKRLLAPWQVDIGPTKIVARSRTPQRSEIIFDAAAAKVKSACRPGAHG